MGVGALAKLGSLMKIGAKGVKQVPFMIEVIDTAADVALLSDQIAMAIMGENYDPAFRDKVHDMLKAGRRVDYLVAAIKRRNSDVEHLHAAIDQLNFTLELQGDKTEISIALVDKIGAISATLSTTPTALTWVQGPAARTDAHLDAETMKASIISVERFTAQVSFDGTRVGFLTATLLLKGSVTAFLYRSNQREKTRQKQHADVDRPMRRPSLMSADILSGAERKKMSRFSKLRSKVTLKRATNIASKSASAISLGLTIYTLVNRMKTRDDAMQDIENQLHAYREAEIGYAYALGGFGGGTFEKITEEDGEIKTEMAPLELPGASAAVKRTGAALVDAQVRAGEIEISNEEPGTVERALDRARTAFSDALEQDDTFIKARSFMREETDPDWDVLQNIGFALGLDGLLDHYELLATRKIEAIRSIFEEMFALLSSELNSGDPTDRLVAKYVGRKGDKDLVEQDRLTFEAFATIALDNIKSGETRRQRGFEPIQTVFSSSIQTMMSRLVAESQTRLRDIRQASELYVDAQMILKRADEEAEKHAKRNEAQLGSQTALMNMLRDMLAQLGKPNSDADVRAHIEKNNLAPKIAPFDRNAYIEAQIDAEATARSLRPVVVGEPVSRFSTVPEVTATLGLMIQDIEASTQRNAA